MSVRPAPPEEFAGQATAVPDVQWRIDVKHRCRYPVGPGNTRCKVQSVAALNRQRWSRHRGGLVDCWWAYCGDHLYGRWIEAGQVMNLADGTTANFPPKTRLMSRRRAAVTT